MLTKINTPEWFKIVTDKALAQANLDGDATTDNGLCGFASVHIPANTSFGRWALKTGLMKKAIVGRGLYIWCPYYNQAHVKKMIWAQSYARILNDYGLNAWTQDSLD